MYYPVPVASAPPPLASERPLSAAEAPPTVSEALLTAAEAPPVASEAPLTASGRPPMASEPAPTASEARTFAPNARQPLPKPRQPLPKRGPSLRTTNLRSEARAFAPNHKPCRASSLLPLRHRTGILRLYWQCAAWASRPLPGLRAAGPTPIFLFRTGPYLLASCSIQFCNVSRKSGEISASMVPSAFGISSLTGV